MLTDPACGSGQTCSEPGTESCPPHPLTITASPSTSRVVKLELLTPDLVSTWVAPESAQSLRDWPCPAAQELEWFCADLLRFLKSKLIQTEASTSAGPGEQISTRFPWRTSWHGPPSLPIQLASGLQALLSPSPT